MSQPTHIEDTNIAGIGSYANLVERIRAAKSEKAWAGIGEKPGIHVWRIENFTVQPWPEEQYGSFYDGNSYIVINSNENSSGKLQHDIHFWLGKNCPADEKGTAAYKTVELEDFLGTLPALHREVQGKESDLFVSYFKNGIHIMKGGIESGFRHVKPEEYKPRLLQVNGKTDIRVRQRALSGESLNQGDCFILDAGLKIFQWEGSKSSRAERYTASTVATNLRSERGGKPAIEIVDEDATDEFWQILGGKPERIKLEEEGGSDLETQKKEPNELWVLSEEAGKLEFKKIASGQLSKDHLHSDDVCLVDVGTKIYAWVGKGSNATTRSHAIIYAMDYAQGKGKVETQIERIIEGSEPSYFHSHFAQQ